MRVGHVVFCEDKTYLLWQTELFIHSLTSRGGIKEEDIVVLFATPEYHNCDKKLHNDSPYLRNLIKKHSGCRYYKVQNYGRRNWYFRYEDNGTWHPRQYPGINKWTSLCEAANAGWLDEYGEVLLLEQDLWFSDKLPTLPAGNCATANWINNRYNAFEVRDKEPDMNTPGFDLDDIMKLCKIPGKSRSKWKGGAIIFKYVTAQLKKAKFLNAIVNYNQLLMTLGELALPQGARHETDMVAPGLAMAHCDMNYTLIEDNTWRSDVWTWHQEPPKGTVVHYGWDFNCHKHLKCTFNKFIYGAKLPWEDIDKYKSEGPFPFKWIGNFIEDLHTLSLYEMDRTCENNVTTPTI